MIEFGDPCLPERFWQKVRVRDSGCWEWIGTIRSVRGYGCFQFNGKSLAAHRLSYSSLVGPIPEGLHIDHLCRFTECVNPEHLEPVTLQENNRRSWLARNAPHLLPEHIAAYVNSHIEPAIASARRRRSA